ncbi:MAG: extracellular solute-binding protein [Deltaproteobacteria bacterium]|nr:extracellular solute-binding protein [Deltaproteobacteria bacterium]
MKISGTSVARSFLVTVLVVFAWVAQSSAQGEFSDNVIQAAKKEGKVVVYATSGWGHAFEKGGDLFFKRYGVKVEALYLRSREVRARITTERRAGRQVADVAAIGDATLSTLWQDGAIESWLPPSVNVIRTEVAEPVGLPRVPLTPIQMNLYGIFINSRLVPAGKEPKCWRDLLDTTWRAKIMLDDPRAAGSGYGWFISLLNHPDLGESYHQKLAQNQPFIVAGGGSDQIQSTVINGQFPVGIPVNVDAFHEAKGAPAKWIAACEGSYYSINSAGLIKGAPHPNAGKLWVDFLVSEPMQRIFGEVRTPVRKGVAAARPEWSLDHVKLLARPLIETAEQRNKNYRLIEKIYGVR